MTRYPLTAHVALAAHVAMQDRFESGQPLAGTAARERLASDAANLAARIGELYRPTTVAWNAEGTELVVTRHEQHPLLPVLARQLVQLETELGKFAPERPTPEDFSLRRAPWADQERIDGDTEELEASATEAELEAIALRFELHAARKSTANRVELAKARLVPAFSWREAWNTTKATMRELGSEARKEDTYARQVRRELWLREQEAERDATWGVECDSDYNLPSEDSECRRIAEEEGRDYRLLAKTPAPAVAEESFTVLVAEAARQRAAARCENMLAEERADAVEDLCEALLG